MGKPRRRAPSSSSESDSDDSDNELAKQFFVQRQGKWVPYNAGSTPKASSSKGDIIEQYFVQRNGKWVPHDVSNFAGGRPSRQPGAVREVVTTAATPQVAAAGPLEHREYFVYVTPPGPAPEPVVVAQPQAPVVQPVPPPQPRPLRAMPNEYNEGPIVPRRQVVYRSPPRCMLPPPRRPSPVRMIEVPPPPMPRPPPRPAVDYYALGREAALRSQPGVPACGCAEEEVPVCGAPRTTPAEGYYLAGYLYYVDPSQPAPTLQPMSLGGGGCMDQPTSVEFEIDEYGPVDDGATDYGMMAGYPQYNPGYPVGYPG